MNKIIYPLIGIVIIMLIFSTIGSLSYPIIDNKNFEIFVRDPVSIGPLLEVTTDKTIYNVGEPVTTFLTNVGDEILSAGGPIITIYNKEDEIIYQEAVYCWHELDPGDYIEWLPWDQTDQQGQQIPVGEYVVEGILYSGENYVDEATFYIYDKGDELDQSQAYYDEDCPGPIGYFPFNESWNVSVAQSFIPTKGVLTRVLIYVCKNATTSYPLTIAIRDSLTGENLAMASVNSDEFMVYPTLSWIQFDFDDIIINIDETYYIIGYTSNIKDNSYICGANCSDVYPNGTAHASFDGGETWQPYPEADACFMTYGRRNQPPNAPTIDGKKSGKPGKDYEYKFNAVDPDGDEVRYFIDWGDNTSFWTDFNASDANVTVKHIWDKKGDYTITSKAQDIYGAEGPEKNLIVTMPRKKAVTNFFLRFLERFQLLIKIIIYYLFN